VDRKIRDVAGSAGDALLALGGLLRRAAVSADTRALFQIGGRDAEPFYRDTAACRGSLS
jgi:nitrate reductase / nitrite oxidoreductase, alpha subunit